MAGDWIKVEKATARKPEVLRLADALSIHPDQAFGLCIRFWFWCDENTADGIIQLSPSLIDHVAGIPGFADALLLIGWLRVRNGSLEVPNFDRHMSQAAKSRVDATERQRRRRNVTKMSQDSPPNTTERITAVIRRAVFERDERRCVYCGWTEKDDVPFGPYMGCKLSIDHVLPATRGGQTVEDNLVTACSVCNQRKGNRTPKEAEMVAMFVTEKCDNCVTKTLPREEKRREEKERKEPPDFSQPIRNPENQDGDRQTFLTPQDPRSDELFGLCWKKVSRGQVPKSLEAAVLRVIGLKSCTDEQAYAWLKIAVIEFAKSPLGRLSPQEKLPSLSRWLDDERYLDDRAVWNSALGQPARKSSEKPKVSRVSKDDLIGDELQRMMK